MPIFFGKEQSNPFKYKGIEGGVIAREKDGFWLGTAAIYVPGTGIVLNGDDGETKEEAIEKAKQGILNHIDALKQNENL